MVEIYLFQTMEEGILGKNAILHHGIFHIDGREHPIKGRIPHRLNISVVDRSGNHQRVCIVESVTQEFGKFSCLGSSYL